MYYFNTDIRINLNDNIHYAGKSGVVVFVLEDSTYSDRYPEKDWSYLTTGLGIEIQDDSRTLFYLEEADEDLEFRCRNENSENSPCKLPMVLLE